MQNPPTTTQEEHVADLLSAYIDNRLTPVERLLVGSHLPKCSSCRAQLASLQSTVALLHELPVVPAPRPFYVYAEQVPAPPAVGVLRRLFAPGWAYGYLRVATTMAALLLVAVVSVDALGLPSFRAAAPAPAASFGAVRAEVTPPRGAAMDRTVAPSASVPPPAEGAVSGSPTEPPKVTAPLTAPTAPGAAVLTPGPAAPAPSAASVAPGAALPPAAGAGPLLAPPATPMPSAPAAAGTPSASAKSANEAATALPAPLLFAGASPAPATADTTTPAAEPAPARPTLPAVATEARPTQAPPSPPAGPALQAPLIAPAAPAPGQETGFARPTALPEPVSAAPMLSESPGLSPVRQGEIGLGVLVIILLALTVYAHRGRKPATRD